MHNSADRSASSDVEKIVTSNPKVRGLASVVLEALIIMRDEDDDEDGWVLPDFAVIARAMTALRALVQHAEDRHRFKIALERIGKEWKDESIYSPEDMRQFACSVVAGGSARSRIGETVSTGDRSAVALTSPGLLSPREARPASSV